MKEKDVLKTNIHKAQKVVILSPNIEEIKNNQNKKNHKESYRNLTKDEEDLLDARTIFKYKSIIKIRPNIPIVTEMVFKYQNSRSVHKTYNSYNQILKIMH